MTTLEKITEREASLTAARTNHNRDRIHDLQAGIAALWEDYRQEVARVAWNNERRTPRGRHS